MARLDLRPHRAKGGPATLLADLGQGRRRDRQQHIVRIKGLLADESSASDRTSLRREQIVESTRARRGLVIDLQTAILMAIGGPGVVWTDWEWSA